MKAVQMEGQLEIKRSNQQSFFRWPAWVNLLCIACAVAMISALSVWAVYQSEATLSENVFSKLRTIQKIESEAVRQWIKSEKQLVGFLAADVDLAERLFAAEFEAEDTRDFLALQLSGVSEKLESNSGLLLTIDRKVVANFGPSWLAKKVFALESQFDKTLLDGRPTFSSLLPAERGSVDDGKVDDNSFALVATVAINHPTEGVVGFLVIAYDAKTELTQVLGSSRIGDTGETVAVNEAGRLISKSRFKDSSNGLSFFADLHRNSIQGERSSTDVELRNERDQRGVETACVSRWMPRIGIGIVTKMDRSEAYAPIIQIRRFMWILCGLLALTTVAAAVYRWHIYRLEKLAKRSDLNRKMLGAYELEEKVGEGGMGVVYRAPLRSRSYRQRKAAQPRSSVLNARFNIQAS